MQESKPCTQCHTIPTGKRNLSKGICCKCYGANRRLKTCIHEGCNLKFASRGYCTRHYLLAIEEGIITVTPKGTIKVCKHEECKITKIHGHGLCRNHYRQFLNRQKPNFAAHQSSVERARGFNYANEWSENSSKRKKLKRDSEIVNVLPENEFQSKDDFIEISINANVLANRAGLTSMILLRYLENLKEDGQILAFTYDKKSLLVSIKIEKSQGIQFFAGFNQLPVGVQQL